MARPFDIAHKDSSSPYDGDQYREAIEIAMDGFWQFDMQGRLIEVNDAYVRSSGYSREELLSMRIPDLEAVENPEETIAHIQKILRDGYDRFESQHRRKDGSVWPVEVATSFVDHDGGRFYAFLRDVTERIETEAALRESEEFNRHIISSSADCIKVLDLAGNLLFMSEGGQRLLEIDDIGRYLNGCWIDFWQEQDRPAVRKAIAAANAGGVGQFRAYCPSEKSTPKWWDVVITPILGADGQTGRLLAVSRDITDRKQIEDALQAAKTEAERANNAKSRFLAAVSHDLRQPLFALDLYVSSLEGKLVPGNSRLLRNMKDNLASLSEMLAKLLDLSKLEAGIVTPEIANFAVTEVFEKLISAHAPEATQKALKLRCVPSRLIARTDAVLFERVLGNLVSNAVRYTEQGGIVIGCRFREGKAWVEVWDTGIGIPEDRTAEIFEEFKQLGNEERNRGKGSGLGLAIVAKTVELLGLKIRVHSRLGGGSLFAVELPLGQAESSATSGVESGRRRLRIALVDDDIGVRESLIFVLEEDGHQVVAAATGAELLSKLDERSPDIIISDYRLARGENGFDAITGVRAAYGRHLPALILTGDTCPELIRSMNESGIIVQHKPMKLHELNGVLTKLTNDASCV
ncbi:MAG: PAS domain S-box protein [Sulfuricella sp.]